MKYNIIVGTRPNFVKLSAFMREAQNHPEHSFRIIHTGQHYDDSMSGIFFKELELPLPFVTLQGQSLEMMVHYLKTYLGDDPVIVFGDTRSALAGALACRGRNNLIHIEAGLRSFDNRMPEETNRIVIDRLSDELFTTEEAANVNLTREGLTENVHYVGNLMTETLTYFFPRISDVEKGEHIVVTIHRVENERNLQSIVNVLFRLSDRVILVLHPSTKKKIETQGIHLNGIDTREPMGYLDFMKLVYSSRGVITDSGGLQEETSFLGIPCATLRDNTERPSTLSCGNKLFSPSDPKISEILKHFEKPVAYRSDFEDNNVAKRIFEHL